MKKKLIILVIPLFCLTLAAVSQSSLFTPPTEGFRYLPQQRYLDSLMVTKLPVLTRSASDQSKLLPPVVDNSKLKFFPGIRSQYMFMSCLQHSGIGYTFSYEINRLRDADGSLSENRYPPHYTWNLFNQGNRENGVNFIHSFEAVMNQGHMTRADYGPDT
ncbi:MAG: hypothetical protein FJY10_12260, partial [Bacteroidetes bacterium]|nr:hypothetical protein [Bacteroidota bacterium]